MMRFGDAHQRGVGLLASILALLLVLPLTEAHRFGRAAVAPLFLLAVALAVAGRPGRGPSWLAVLMVAAIAVLWLVARIEDLTLPLGGASVLRCAPPLGLALTLVILARILNGLTAARQITRGILAEAFTGYLLVGIAFAELYGLLDGLLPHAFSVAPPPGSAMTMFVYFSLGTLASVGFGDIVALHPFVRIVAVLEGVCGLFYTAIVVAGLVAHGARKHRRTSRYRRKTKPQ